MGKFPQTTMQPLRSGRVELAWVVLNACVSRIVGLEVDTLSSAPSLVWCAWVCVSLACESKSWSRVLTPEPVVRNQARDSGTRRGIQEAGTRFGVGFEDCPSSVYVEQTRRYFCFFLSLPSILSPFRGLRILCARSIARDVNTRKKVYWRHFRLGYRQS